MTSQLSTASIQSVLGLCRAQTGTLLGLELQSICVEVASRRGPANFQLAGLADASVRESRVRVASALSGVGLTLDEYALTVNLAPANIRKVGSALDLAIAAAICGAVGLCSPEATEGRLIVGELALDGSVRPITGVLPLLEGARRLGVAEVIVPAENAREASFVPGINVRQVGRLAELLTHLRGERAASLVTPAEFVGGFTPSADLADVRGQEPAKRALLIAAAGNHHLLMVGPPGSGKTLLARRLAGLLPPLDCQKALETTGVHSVAGLVDPARGIIDTRPFRAPHHTVSEPGLVGGGSWPRPGELSLAHNGVLFLDELPEFRRSVLESLRQPLESHEVHIVRAKSRAIFPARPLVVAAMNPCPCGHYGNPTTPCRCSPERRRRYLDRLSGPLLERLDLHVMVPSADVQQWTSGKQEPRRPGTAEARQVVARARGTQLQRFERGEVDCQSNADLSLEEAERVARPDEKGRLLLAQAVTKLGLSARTYVRVLRTARTIADVDGRDAVTRAHVGEAIRYRMFGTHDHEL